MKKNLLSVLILALLIVNIILTAIMMFSVAGASKKTSALVTDIASVLRIEISGAQISGDIQEDISLENSEFYDMEELIIPLKMAEDGKLHYAVVNLTLSMNTKDAGYKTYSEKMATMEGLIQSQVTEIYGGYTQEEAADLELRETIMQQILNSVQKIFDSKFIYKVSLRNIKIQ